VILTVARSSANSVAVMAGNVRGLASLAIGFPETEAMEPRKAAILRVSLGTAEFRIYSSLATNPRESYGEAVKRLATHFGQPASTIFNHAEFTRRQQRSGESVTQYIAALREIASKCARAPEPI
jgi:hypothetical protein